MAITIDWPSAVLTVPKSFLTLVQLVPSEIYKLDTEALRIAIRDLEDDEEGRGTGLRVVDYTAPKTLDGVTYASFIEIRAPFTVTFEDGAYRVIFEGSNNNILTRSNVNNVSLAPQNSAGLTFSQEVQNLSYTDDRIYIAPDAPAATALTRYPAGTRKEPTVDFPTASTINSRLGYNRYHLVGLIVLLPTDMLVNANLKGETGIIATTVFAGTDLSGAKISETSVTGAVTGTSMWFDRCLMADLSGFDGVLELCAMSEATIQVAVTAVNRILIYDCMSLDNGGPHPIIDMNGASAFLSVRNFTGLVDLANFNVVGGTEASVHVNGKLHILPSCTTGKITVSGECFVLDQSGPDCEVILESTVQRLIVNEVLP